MTVKLVSYWTLDIQIDLYSECMYCEDTSLLQLPKVYPAFMTVRGGYRARNLIRTAG